MKAKDLRLGNLINVKCIAKECGHDEFDPQECNIHNIKGILEGNDDFLYEPIPLTEEWLIKFGFEKVIYESDETGYGTDYELDIKGVGCISYSDDFSCALFGSKESSKHELGFLPNWDNCKHVHSLQNLYFALIGEELKIKE
jgi:hypothetical protein